MDIIESVFSVPSFQSGEIVFIESNVADYQSLINGINPATDIYVLDAATDGLTQMVQILAGRNGIDTIHIISHGAEGVLQLGAVDLNDQTLQSRADDLAAIGSVLSPEGDILLYGCNVAKGNQGLDFIVKLALATGADIAASDNYTGTADQGGDWVLEVQTGGIEGTRFVPNEAYAHLLAPADQNFDSAGAGDKGSQSYLLNGMVYTTNDSGALNVSIVNDGNIASGGDLALGYRSSGVGNTTLTAFRSSDGSEFKLNSFVISTGLGDTTVTIKGYLDGSEVASGLVNTASFTTFNVSGNSLWENIDEVRMTGADLDLDIDDLDFSPAVPLTSITSATYDAGTNVLAVTGIGMTTGDNIDVTKLTFTGAGADTYSLTSANVTASSAAAFSVTLNAADQANVEGLLNKIGTTSVDGITFNLAAAANWDSTASAAADNTGNGVTVSSVQTPTITSATYNAATGVLVVTGSNLVKTNGATNDIAANKLTFTGEGGVTYTLTNTANVETDGGNETTSFTLTLSATDKAAINQIVNKDGVTSTGGTTFNLAAADDWNSVITAGDISDASNAVTVSNVPVPTITSATYNTTTSTLVVTGTGFLSRSGATNDIVASKLTFTGEGGMTHTLTDTANVDISSGTAFTITLSATDEAAISLIINKNGISSTSGTTFNLAAAEDWAAGADSSVVTADLAGNGITASNVAVPTITSATYDSATGALVVAGTGFLSASGAANDIVANKLTITGEGGTYTLTDTANVDIFSGTAFTISLSATDETAINQIINKNGTSSTSGTTFNLAAAEDWAVGADSAVVTADLAGNGITASNVAVPAITSATYDFSTNVLTVTGTDFLSKAGATNDIDLTKLTITGEGGTTYTLTNATGVEITSGTSFSVTLSGADLTNVEALLNKDGTSAVSSTTYNLSAAANWNPGDATGGSDTTNVITESNYAAPTVTSAMYDASTNVLTVTGTNLVSKSGVTNDVTVALLTITGEGGSYALTSTNVEVTSASSFAVTLNTDDQLVLLGLLNKNGTTSSDATPYNLAAAEDWMAGSAAATVVADLAGNSITVSNVPMPTITSSAYDSDTGILTVTGTNLFHKVGGSNDIDLTKLTFTGQGGGGAAYTLTSATGVEITSATSFSITLTGADKTNVDALLNQIGTTATDTTTYNLSAADNWLSGADAAANIADTVNAVTVSIAPKITFATYDATTGSLVVTGSNMQAKAGVTNDITANKLTFTGEGDSTYTLTDTANVELTSATAFTLTLSAADKAAINQIVNKNGTASTGGTTFNLAAADDWNAQVTAGDISDTGNAVTVSNVPAPTINSATYNAATGALVVTGTGFLKLNGATNDIVANKFTLTGEGASTYTLIDSVNAEITSGTAFTLMLSVTDKTAIDQIINKIGVASTDASIYNLAAAEDWTAGADSAVVTADLVGNGITVTNVPAPTITSATYDSATGALVVTGTKFVHLSGPTNDIVANKFTITGQSGATYTLTDTANVEISDATHFTLTLSANDQAAINLILNKDGTVAVDSTSYNLAAAEDWAAGADAAVVIADLIGNGINKSGPPKSLSFSATTLAEAATNNGAITVSSTITLTNDTFTGANGSYLGVVSNVPAGLIAHLLKTSATTATLSFTGNATEHANAQDVHNLTVIFSDGDFTGASAADVTGATTANLFIDFADPVAPPPPTTDDTTLVDGVTVNSGTQTTSDGSQVTVVSVEPIISTRTEDTSTPHGQLADIPLVTDASGSTILQIGLPIGVGVESSNNTSDAGLSLRQQLINASDSSITNSAALAQVISDGIDLYVPSVADQSQVTVRTLTLTVAAGTGAPSQHIVVSGATGTGEGDAAHPLRQEALVIDAQQLPAGTVIDLDQVEFAIIIGAATVTGGAGRNFVIGDESAQTIILGAEDDILHGGAGNDTVGSRGGDDQLYGDAGNDLLVGGVGNDTLSGGLGDDILQGGQSDAGTWTFKLDTQQQLHTTFTADDSRLAENAVETATGTWSQSTSALTSHVGVGFTNQSTDVLETIALLYHALGQRAPELLEMNYWATQGYTNQQLTDIAYNAHIGDQRFESTGAQANDLIGWLWGTSAVSDELTHAVTEFIEAGGHWADVVSVGIYHDNFRAALLDAQGSLNLVQSYHSEELGWSADTGNDTLNGGDGSDTLIGGRGSDVLDGGNGIDTAVFSGDLADYVLIRSGSAWSAEGNNDTDSLFNVERLQFADTKLAIDLDGHAGTTLKVLGAVFGADSLSNRVAVGVGLSLLDGGMSEADLILAAMSEKLGTGFSNSAEVTLLYQNILGFSPPTEELRYWTEALDSGEFTQAELAVTAAELQENASQIGLVGLQQAGTEYA